ncbi:MAG: MFS transporter [Streptosporangiales bacterium]|nr:MFS transporter [Streptosporangiales bacterium]
MQDERTLERTVLRKAAVRLLPLTLLMYFVAYVDRANVSVAALQMNEDLQFSNTVYGLGAGVFFLGYFLFEVPSNLILARVGARRWLARIMFTWGLVTVAFVFVDNAVAFYVLRFLLGVAEAGLYPGIVLYLTYWFPARGMGRALSWFQLAAPLSLAVSTPMLGALLGLDGFGGLAGWRWLFLVTAVPPLVLAFVVWRFLTDRPDQAKWLTGEERDWLLTTMERERNREGGRRRHTMRGSFTDRRIWLASAAFFAVLVSFGGVLNWLPQIVQALTGSGDFTTSLITAIPYAVACVALLLVGRHSDRTGERRWHAAVSYFVGTAGFLLSLYIEQPVIALFGLVLVISGIQSAIPGFWGLCSTFVTGAATASAFALINSVGNLGGFVGPYLMGVLADSTGSQRAGLFVMSLFLLLGGVLIAIAGRGVRREPASEPSDAA